MSFRNMLVRGVNWPDDRRSQLLLAMSADLRSALVTEDDGRLLVVPTSELKIVRPYFNTGELPWAGSLGDFVAPPAPHAH
jgi:hypothetical protein